MDKNIPDNTILLQQKLAEKGWTYKYDLYEKELNNVKYINNAENSSVSIVIIAWRYIPEILENIEAISQQRFNNIEIIFVNNGANEQDFAEIYPYTNTVVHLNNNTGAYLARNLGALFAKSEILLFVDDDGLAHANMVQAHLNAHRNYDVIAVRGAIYPKTDNPANAKALHYNLGPKPFPTYADIEGNTSYSSAIFFRAGGWDDEIIFGGGGFELSLRLNKLESDKRKQIYIPDAILYHDYCDDEKKLRDKLKRQAKSRERLRIIHPNYDRFMKSWIPFKQRDDVLIRKNGNVNSINHIAIGRSTIDLNMKRIQTLVDGKTAYNKEIEKALELVNKGLKRAAIPRLKRLLKYPESYDIAKKTLLEIGETDIPEKTEDSIISHSQHPCRYKISVLIPTYNRCKYLDLAIYSALGQTVSPFEVVVVDDGSTDETEVVVSGIKDKRLRYIKKEHSGAPQTRNRAIQEARGDYILWLDSDDFLLENVIGDFSSVLDKFHDVDVVYGNLLISESDLKPRKPLMYPDWWENNDALVARLIQSNGVPNPSTLIRKSSFDIVGLYDVTFKRAHDYDWWVRSSRKLKFKHSGVFTLLWRWHDTNMSSGSVKIDFSYDARIVRNMLEQFPLNELYPVFDWKNADRNEVEAMALMEAAQKLLELNDVHGGVNCLKLAYERNPAPSIKTLIDSLSARINASDETTDIHLFKGEVQATETKVPGLNFEKVLELSPENEKSADFKYKMAVELLNKKQINECTVQLEAALDVYPKHLETIRLLRHLQRQLGQEYCNILEERMFSRLKVAWGTDNWKREYLRTVALWNAPGVFNWIKEKIVNLEAKREEYIPGSTPRVSFIVPAYNDIEFIDETIASIQAQTKSCWEIIIVDDGSDDGKTHDYVEKLTSRDRHRIRVIHLKQNSGLPTARNSGAEIAKGEFIVFLDSDDLISPYFIEKSLEVAEKHPEAAWVAGHTINFGSANRIFVYEQYSIEKIFIRNLFNCTNMIGRSVWKDLDGINPEMIEGYEDWEFWIRASIDGYRPAQIDEPLFFYRRKENSMLEGIKDNMEKGLRCKLQIINNNPEMYKPIGASDRKLLLETLHIISPNIVNEKQLAKISKIPNPLKNEVPVKKEEEYTLGNFRAVIPEGVHDSPQNVLIVCHDFPPYHWAGAQLYALDVAKGLQSQGIHVEVFHGAFRGEFAPDYTIHQKTFQGVPVNILAKENSLEHERLINPRVEQAFTKFLEENHFDVIHFHGLGQLSLAPLIVANRKNIKTVYTYHDFWMACHQWFLLKPDGSQCSGPETPEKCAECYLTKLGIQRNEQSMAQASAFTNARFPLFRETMKKIDLHIAPSQYYCDIMESHGAENIQLHPYGMKEVQAIEKPRRERFVFGYIGQISRRKGLDILLEAFDTPELSNCQLNIHGNVHDPVFAKPLLEKIDRMPNVSWFGKYTPDQLPDIMAGMDISCVPTRMDNFPLIIMESYQHNTPVIASDAGGVPEMVKEKVSGLVFESENALHMREKLIWAYQNRNRVKDMGDNVPRVLNVLEDARLTHKRYYDLLNQDANKSQKIKVLFYFFKNVHAPILLPIYEELAKDSNFEVAFALHPYNLDIRAGFLPQEEAEIRKTPVKFYENPREFGADISIMADNVAPLLDGCGKIINVGHGLLSKGQYFTDTDFINRENLEDILCVPGEYHRNKILQSRKVFIPVIATGFAKLDRLFNGSLGTRDSLLKDLELDPSKRVILFAPTFNDELSAIPVLEDSISVLADDNTYLLIKLHGSTKAEYKDMYRSLAKKQENVIYIENQDLAPSMLMADVMVSDVSSAFMEFMALDKPVVLFNNPDQNKYQNYDKRDIEYAWRDLGIEVENLEELYTAVQRSFENPGEFSGKRQHYARQLLSNIDGKGALNIVKVIKDLNAGEFLPINTVADRTAVILNKSNDNSLLDRTLSSLNECGENIEVFLFEDNSRETLEKLKSKHKFNLKTLKNNWKEFDKYKESFSYIVKGTSGVTFEQRKLFRLVNHLRRDNNTQVVVPLVFNGIPAQNPLTIFDLGQNVPTNQFDFDRQLRSAMVGKSMPFENDYGNVVVIKNKVSNDSFILSLFENRPNNKSERACIALDAVVQLPEVIRVSKKVNTIANNLFSNAEGNGHLRMALHYENKKNFEKARRFILEAYKNYPDSAIVREVMIRLGIEPENEG